MAEKSVLMRPQGQRSEARAFSCPSPLCYANDGVALCNLITARAKNRTFLIHRKFIFIRKNVCNH